MSQGNAKGNSGGGGGSGGTALPLVFQPGGTAQANVFTTESTISAAVNAAHGPQTVYLDLSNEGFDYTATGPLNLGEFIIGLTGPYPNELACELDTAFALTTPIEIRDFELGITSPSPGFTTPPAFLRLTGFAGLAGNTLAYTVPAGQTSFIEMYDNSYFNGNGVSPMIQVSSTGTLVIRMYDGANLPYGNIAITSGGSVDIIVYSDGASVDAGYAGLPGFNIEYVQPILLIAGGVSSYSSPYFNQTTIAAGSNGATLPQSTIFVANNANFPTTGIINIWDSGAGKEQIAYTGITGTSFTGCTGGSGTLATGQLVIQYPRGITNLSTNTGTALGTIADYSTITGGDQGSVTQSYGTIGGGLLNTVNGQYGTVAGGNGNSANGLAAFAAGSGCAASGTAAVALGNNSTSSGPYSFATGNGNTANGQAGVAMGIGSAAAGTASVATGFSAYAFSDFMRAHSGTNGAGQVIDTVYGGQDINGTGTVINDVFSNSLTLRNGYAYVIRARVIATRQDTVAGPSCFEDTLLVHTTGGTLTIDVDNVVTSGTILNGNTYSVAYTAPGGLVLLATFTGAAGQTVNAALHYDIVERIGTGT